ncbi:uncharacterized protein LOC111291165 [Durio zibethinus]|uniref:Uncharacterized protein LOC111291165 n=1 Tax=Durio zibethinus TaxID=66656 RepID=A0A6P5YDD2_DURZI|nr:uncharacterized protein LOC111291165 [Durio zibethinus]
MKDLSFFLLKNSIGAKMKKGIRNFCNGDGSTSTLNQHQAEPGGVITSSDLVTPPSVVASNTNSTAQSPPTTLEEMILRLELEEELARKAKLNEYSEIRGRRMSCVNNSDILRSARNALNQYPRFSLDGKDAMYRSSFRNSEMAGRKSVCCDHELRDRYCKIEFESRLGLPTTLGGESVIWCKPGVVAKLMGLESMPVAVNTSQDSKQKLSSMLKKQNHRKRAERHEMERRLAMDMSNNYDDFGRERNMGSSSRAGYRVTKPVVVEPASTGDGGWPTRRFL